MERIWAPWREPYITAVTHPRRQKDCVFCRMCKSSQDRQNYVFARSLFCFAVLNIYPYNNGHALILPYRHVKDLGELRREEKMDLFELLEYTQALLEEVLKPHGFNIGLNLGRVAGAGVPGHLHFHIVPRWSGDVNFMPVVNNTRIISQSLKTLNERLTRAHRKRKAKSK